MKSTRTAFRSACGAAVALTVGCGADSSDTTNLSSSAQEQSTARVTPTRTAVPASEEATDPVVDVVTVVPERRNPVVVSFRDEMEGPDAGADPEPTPPLPLPCVLELEWQDLTMSHAGCKTLSGALQVERVLWDGTSISLLGAPVEPVAGRLLERMRRCPRTPEPVEGAPSPTTSQSWRFVEAFDFGASLPTDHCPSAFSASYEYAECMFNNGRVCWSTPETGACSFSATLRVTPRPLTAEEAGPDGGSPTIASTPKVDEAKCRTIGSPALVVPVPLDGACTETRECQSGSFCSREKPDGTCSDFGTGVCRPAPDISECSDVIEPVCLCDDRTDSASNPCRVRAAGETSIACPAAAPL
jgi:hypothetical protein